MPKLYPKPQVRDSGSPRSTPSSGFVSTRSNVIPSQPRSAPSQSGGGFLNIFSNVLTPSAPPKQIGSRTLYPNPQVHPDNSRQARKSDRVATNTLPPPQPRYVDPTPIRHIGPAPIGLVQQQPTVRGPVVVPVAVPVYQQPVYIPTTPVVQQNSSSVYVQFNTQKASSSSSSSSSSDDEDEVPPADEDEVSPDYTPPPSFGPPFNPSAPPEDDVSSTQQTHTQQTYTQSIPRKTEYQKQSVKKSSYVRKPSFIENVGYRLYSLAAAVGKVAIGTLMVLGVTITGGMTYFSAKVTMITLAASPVLAIFPLVATVGLAYTTVKTCSFAFGWFFRAAKSFGSSVQGY